MRAARRFLLVAGLAASGAMGAMPAKNLAFEQWDEARNWPQAWGGRRSQHFEVAHDCEVKRAQRCSLRIVGHANRPAGDFQPLVQNLAPVVSDLPSCQIRDTCRWFAEEGGEACLRCPQVVTLVPSDQNALRQAAYKT